MMMRRGHTCIQAAALIEVDEKDEQLVEFLERHKAYAVKAWASARSAGQLTNLPLSIRYP